MEDLVNYQQLRSYYKGKRVFITGHTGFKGIWLKAILHMFGATVKGYSLEPEDSKPFYQLFSSYKMEENIIADIRDKEKLKAEIIAFQPDFVFHLAAQSLVLRSYKIPSETFEINVVGTANILEALQTLDKKCTTIIITTDKVYENKEKNILYKEDDILGGYDPYSASKACTEIVVQSFRNAFFNIEKLDLHEKAISSARAGNVIGGGDWNEDRIIPDCIRSLMNNEAINVRNPGAVRPWQHVLEPLSGYLLLGMQLDKQPGMFSKPFNFGPYQDDHLTVKELVELVIKIWGKGKIKISNNINAHHEANLLQLDIQRAISELKWQPRLTAQEAIQWTIDWYKKDIDQQAEFTFRQIDNYFKK